MASNEFDGLFVYRDHDALKSDRKTVVHHLLRARSEQPLVNYSLNNIAFLNFPFLGKERRFLQHELKDYTAGVKRGNAPGLHRLSFWLNEAIDETLNLSPLFLADEFQLEANLKQFDIEVNSKFLRWRLEDLSLGGYPPRKLEELNRLLAIQLVAINDIKQGLEKILALHPQLLEIYEKIFIFQQVLTSHLLTPQYGLLYLLYFEMRMKLMSVLIGDIEQEETQNFIALWLALREFIKTSSWEKLDEEDPDFQSLVTKHLGIFHQREQRERQRDQ